jgi:hypothetical protein
LPSQAPFLMARYFVKFPARQSRTTHRAFSFRHGRLCVNLRQPSPATGAGVWI